MHKLHGLFTVIPKFKKFKINSIVKYLLVLKELESVILSELGIYNGIGNSINIGKNIEIVPSLAVADRNREEGFI